MDKENFLLINSKILPPVFEGVVHAKELIATGKVSSAAAAKQAGISRSAFYKYKDFVFKYSPESGESVNLNAILSDRAGVFSGLTSVLSENGANIVTVTQGLPENGTANVSMTLSFAHSAISVGELIDKLAKTDGVISIKTVDGGKR